MDSVVLMMYAASLVRIALLVVIGVPVLSWCRIRLLNVCFQRFSHHSCVLLGRVIFYSGVMLIVVAILHELGFNITALLGVAGVFGFAVGFASQTSISNIISGFFLVLERPFSMGDIIKSGDIVGVVESINLLSLNVRTLDNKLVRLPNETVLKNSLVNITYYPIKRMDFVLSVPYTADAQHVIAQVFDTIKSNKLFLQEPAPVVMMQKIAQHDYDTETRNFFTVRVWVAKEHFSSAPGILMQQLKDQFDKIDCIITALHTNPN
jgi:small-conductance mechanosensitive channel